jgi:hypothetical protein
MNDETNYFRTYYNGSLGDTVGYAIFEDVVTARIFEEVATVKLQESFTRPLQSSTRTSCTDIS